MTSTIIINMTTSSLSQRLWRDNFDLALACRVTPFCRSLQEGTLSSHAHQTYIIQDAMFLNSCKKVYDRAAILCQNHADVHGVKQFSNLRDSLNAELDKSAEILSPPHTRQPVDPETLAHSSFMEEVMREECLSKISASIVSCLKLFTYLDNHAQSSPINQSPHLAWISEGHSLLFQSHTSRLESLLEYYIAKEHIPFDDISIVYSKSLQHKFHCLSSKSMNPLCGAAWDGLSNFGLFAIDFDSTITEKDTVSDICLTAIRSVGGAESKYFELEALYQSSHQQILNDALPPAMTSKPTQSLTASIFPSPFSAPPPPFLSSSLSAELEAFMEVLGAFEKRMVVEVETAGILRGLNRHMLRAIGQKTPLRRDCLFTLLHGLHRQPRRSLRVVSLNWSRTLLLAALRDLQPRVIVHCNEVEGVEGPDPADWGCRSHSPSSISPPPSSSSSPVRPSITTGGGDGTRALPTGHGGSDDSATVLSLDPVVHESLDAANAPSFTQSMSRCDEGSVMWERDDGGDEELRVAASVTSMGSVTMGGTGTSTGRIIKSLTTGLDKLALLRSLLPGRGPHGIPTACDTTASPSPGAETKDEPTSLLSSDSGGEEEGLDGCVAGPSVFVGDSLGDLPAMLEADVGVLIGGSATVARVCTAFGITMRPLDALLGLSLEQVRAQGRGVIFTASSWPHIGFCLFGFPFANEWVAALDMRRAQSWSTMSPSTTPRS